jgi:hypothetical protein
MNAEEGQNIRSVAVTNKNRVKSKLRNFEAPVSSKSGSAVLNNSIKYKMTDNKKMNKMPKPSQQTSLQ